ncbi:MAG: AAA family ATPase [Phycisphaerae bacterium]|jgi:predicted ATPase
MLKRLRLHNFKSFLNFEMDFTSRHLLIGKNNSGKTNLCSAIRFLGATARTDLATAAANCIQGGIPEIQNWNLLGKPIDFKVICELPFEGSTLTYQYDLSLEATGIGKEIGSGEVHLRLIEERLKMEGGGFSNASLLVNDGREAHLLHEESTGKPEGPYTPRTLAPQDATMLSRLYALKTNRRAILFRQFLQSWMYFRLSPDSIRSRWRDAERSGSLYQEDGRHLPSAIFKLKNEDDRRYRRLIQRVKDNVEPDLEAINFLVSPDQGVVPYVTLRGRPRASWAVLSDGTLLALALSQFIEQADAQLDDTGPPPPLMIIEEPENGLYTPVLRELLEDFEKTPVRAQFIFTSHSPNFIDLFDRDLSNVTALKKEDDVTVAMPLVRKKETIERHRGDFSLGELHFKELFA